MEAVVGFLMGAVMAAMYRSRCGSDGESANLSFGESCGGRFWWEIIWEIIWEITMRDFGGRFV